MRKKEYVKMEIEKFTIDLSYKISFFFSKYRIIAKRTSRILLGCPGV